MKFSGVISVFVVCSIMGCQYAGEDAGKLNRFAAWCVQQMRTEGKESVRYDAFTQLRLGAGASLGAAGMYDDYVFYDRDDRVLKACRMQLD